VPTVKVIYWRDIPSVVQATDGLETVKVALSERFQTLIDAVAMRLGLIDADDYLEQWHHGEAEDRSGGVREVAEAVAAELESQFADFQERGLGES